MPIYLQATEVMEAMEFLEIECLPGKQVSSFHEIWTVVKHLGIPVAIL